MTFKRVLAIDTAFAACNVATLDVTTDQVLSATEPMARGQAERLVPLIQDVMKRTGWNFTSLDLIVVTVGPGSFTGLRVGIATARGLALAAGCPVQGVVTTDAFAAPYFAKNSLVRDVHVALDTGRDDYFVASYADATRLPINPHELTIMMAEQIKDLVFCLPEVTAPRWPDAGEVARLGLRLARDDKTPMHLRTDPIYVRDAEVSQPKLQGRILLDPMVAQ
jgi:tRNA threonylcarbamoyladenosine biosynthesis protein TsaB